MMDTRNTRRWAVLSQPHMAAGISKDIMVVFFREFLKTAKGLYRLIKRINNLKKQKSSVPHP